jgi:hypothetical protein
MTLVTTLWGGWLSTVKLHEYGENGTPGCREGQEKESMQEGEGRVNHNTAPSTKTKKDN